MSEKEEAPEAKKVEAELDDEALEKLAVEELLREAAKGAARAQVIGPSGWVNPNKPTPNRFLVNTIRNAVTWNNYSSSSRKSSSHSHYKSKYSSDSKISKDKHRRH